LASSSTLAGGQSFGSFLPRGARSKGDQQPDGRVAHNQKLQNILGVDIGILATQVLRARKTRKWPSGVTPVTISSHPTNVMASIFASSSIVMFSRLTNTFTSRPQQASFDEAQFSAGATSSRLAAPHISSDSSSSWPSPSLRSACRSRSTA
jgi:hypothetical protein